VRHARHAATRTVLAAGCRREAAGARGNHRDATGRDLEGRGPIAFLWCRLMPIRTRARGSIAAVGEFGFLSRLLPLLRPGRGTIVGPGQDCAVVRPAASRLLLTVDALVQGVHFETKWLSPRQLGRRSLLINVSDVAAMGGRPRFCVVNLQVSPAYPAQDLL